MFVTTFPLHALSVADYCFLADTTYSIAEKGISRNVNGKSYTDVIHVSTSIASSLIPAASLTTSINSYYAKKYGLIENTSIISLNYLSIVANINVETKLVSANIL
jgi:hypothetical protein